MPKVTKRICLDVAKNNRAETIFAKQYDYNSRFVTATICNNGERIVVQPSAQVVFNVRREDDLAKAFLGTVNANGTVTVPLTSWALELGGIISCSISVVENERKLTTTSFAINIEDVEYSGENITEDEGKDLIVELIAASDKANAAAQSAVEAAISASGAAEKADTAVQNANEAASAAQFAAGKANTSAQSADEAATAANNAVERAETAAQDAGKAATTANSAAKKADISAQSADEAAIAANNAAEGAENVNISVEETLTGANITVTDRAGTATTVHIDTLNAISTWADIRNAVRMGLGEKLFPVGYEFTTVDTDTGVTLVWAVRGHDHHTPTNSHLTHSMTLEMKNVYSGSNGSQKAVQFDAQEALYYAADGLAAGTYNFTVANQPWYTADNGKTFQFTLSNAVPAGGQIVVTATYNQALAGKSVKTYSSPSSAAAIETTTLTEGSSGTSLGTTDDSDNVNHFHRIVLGSNNYAQSAVRQWLNSQSAAGSVWTPTNKFDRPPMWAATYNGFMHGLPADFLAVVEPAVIPCRTNSIFECASLDGTEFTTNQTYSLKDKFFLLSRPEIYGSWDSATYKDGELLDYYDGLTNAERKKYDNGGTVRYAWLRSPDPSGANYVRIVYAGGSLHSSSASSSLGVAPDCIIA